MPSLLLFVPCERVAFDSADHSSCLIGVFQGFTATKVTKEYTQKQAPKEIGYIVDTPALPIRWCAFSLWRRLPEDAENEFEQLVQLITPSGRESVRIPLSFKMSQKFHRNTVHIANFPVGESGDYILKISLRQPSGEFAEKGIYPISVDIALPQKETESICGT